MMQTVIQNGTFSEEEITRCILYTKKRWGVRLPKDLKLILAKDEAGNIAVSYEPPIERGVYRSTDYLVNDLEKLNAAKHAEQLDKHFHLTAE